MSEDRTLKVGGKDYTLKMTLKSLRLIGDKLKVRIRPGHINEDLLNQPLDLGVFGVVLWACLQHHAEPPSLDDVELSVDQDNFAEVLERFFGLFGVTSPVGMHAMMMAGEETPSQETEPQAA